MPALYHSVKRTDRIYINAPPQFFYNIYYIFDGMKVYIEIYFHCEGDEPLKVIKRLKDLNFSPVVGEYDFVKEYNTTEEYAEIVTELYNALKGTGVRYRLITRKA